MRHSFLFIVSLALLSGCWKEVQLALPPLFGARGASYYLSTLRFEAVEKNAWAIIAPRVGHPRKTEEQIGNESVLLRRHFPTLDVLSYPPGLLYDFFYATYPLPDRELAVFISIIGAPTIDKIEDFGWNGEVLRERIVTDDSSCTSRKLQGAIVSFNAIDVDFDTASLYYLKKGEKTTGTLIKAGKRGMFVDIQKYEHTTYNLAAAATIDTMQMYGENCPWGCVKGRYYFYNYPTFHYIFEMTCTDLEDAVLVIDGLYHKGERLPSLKVRMNYVDFSKVPKYVGVGPEAAARTGG